MVRRLQVEPNKSSWKVLRDLLVHTEAIAQTLGFEVEWTITWKGTNMEIEILEGETLTDALTRIAKERTKLEIVEGRATKAEPTSATPRKKRSNSPRSTKVTRNVTDPMGGEPVSDKERNTIYRAIHCYQRSGETDQKARLNARREREMSGPATLVFSHLHSFGAPCSSSCYVRLIEGE